ncbi:cardiolipin synthase ClsB [Piscinibacter sp. XHJ-5]|uniref:cardiolipin synthase ClsB n=1 Tax=Piscinibacter sp. XHJ-5 TaxID=3037797 RepID=UPI002452DE8C|nr:cardiolipin synthase ClsB [Piscinibacter sp. XHJ-5]
MPPPVAESVDGAGLDPLARMVPRAVFSGGNDVRLLRGGDELFPAMRRAIATARHEIWLATYIFHTDSAATAIAQALCDASRRGVQVRVVIDGFGSRSTLPALQAMLCEAGVGVAVFRPIHRWWNWLQPGQLRRLHQKLCVVDGEVGFVGGINLIDDRLDIGHGWSDEPRLDFAVQLRGPVVAAIEQAGKAVWSRAHLGQDFRKEIAALARNAEPMAHARRLLGRLRLPSGKAAKGTLADLPPVRAAFVLRDNLRRRRTIERSYIAAMRKARSRIDLASPYFYPGGGFRAALRQAARRGVEVRLLLQGKLDYRIAGLAARSLYDELLGAGVRIFEYTPAYLHAKVALVDDEWATVGSSNIDPLSLLLNLEANVVVRDPQFSRELGAEFDRAFAVSQEIDPKQSRRSVQGALRRGFVAWCAHVYLRIAGATGKY